MALGRRRSSHQGELFVTSADLPQSPGHVFYDKLNQLLAEAGFDRFVEDLCRPHYADASAARRSRRGRYFRMLFVGYFEGLDSQRGIAWRCADSLSLRAFLGHPADRGDPRPFQPDQDPQAAAGGGPRAGLRPRPGDRPREEALEGQDGGRGLDDAGGQRRHEGHRPQGHRRGLEGVPRSGSGRGSRDREPDRRGPAPLRPEAEEEGVQQGVGVADRPDSRIAKMKDGTTHLAYKAEHVVDLDSEFVLAAAVHPADQGDAATLVDSVLQAQVNLVRAGCEDEIEEAVADKGYHKAETLAECAEWDMRTYIPEPKRQKRTLDGQAGVVARGDGGEPSAGAGASGASGCRRSGASWWSGASPTCARRAAVGGRGCGVG